MLGGTNIGTLVVSIVTILGLIIAKELNTFLARKLPVPIPVELIAVSEFTHVHPPYTLLNSCPHHNQAGSL